MRNELKNDVRRYEEVWKDTSEAIAFARFQQAIGTSIANNAKAAKDVGDTVVEGKSLNLLPEFTPVSSPGHIVWIDGLHGSDASDFRKADAAVFVPFKGLNGSTDTWHHHEVMGIMQSVPHKFHKIKHWGGARMYIAITGEGYPNRRN